MGEGAKHGPAHRAAEIESGISRIQSAVTPPTAAKGTAPKTNAESRRSR